MTSSFSQCNGYGGSLSPWGSGGPGGTGGTGETETTPTKSTTSPDDATITTSTEQRTENLR